MDAKPLLLLDVDGPLNPFGAASSPPGYSEFSVAVATGLPDRVVLNPDHGPMLLTLADVFDLTWATAWEAGANTEIAPLVGLLELPVVVFDIDYGRVRDDAILHGVGHRLHWKSPKVFEYAAGRPFLWFDDELSDFDERFFAEAHLPIPFALRRIDPSVGLTAEDIVEARAWAESIAAGPATGRIQLP
jgi:hypothetical protein